MVVVVYAGCEKVILVNKIEARDDQQILCKPANSYLVHVMMRMSWCEQGKIRKMHMIYGGHSRNNEVKICREIESFQKIRSHLVLSVQDSTRRSHEFSTSTWGVVAARWDTDTFTGTLQNIHGIFFLIIRDSWIVESWRLQSIILEDENKNEYWMELFQ